MRRTLRPLQMPGFGIAAVVIAFLVRGSAALGQSAQRYPDSIGYDTLKFFSPVDRPWPIPLIFSLAGTDTVRMVAHVVLGTLAWGALAWVLSRRVQWQRLVFVSVFLLGLSPQVIRYDVAILSESLSITFAVSTIAATVYRLHVRTIMSNTWWAASLTLCVLSRPTHLLIVVLCVLPVMWKLIATRGKSLTWGGIGLLTLLLVGIFTIQQSQHMSLLNLYTVVSTRVITDDERFEWFVDNGMPNVPDMRSATGYDYSGVLPPDVATIVQLPVGQQPPTLMRVGGTELATWLKNNGWRTVAKYLATHPADTMSHARRLAHGTLSPPNGDFLPLQNGPMLPWSFFAAWELWGVVFAAGVGISALRGSTRAVAKTLLSMFAATFLVYLATVHTSGIEHVRHSSTVAVVVRVLGLTAFLAFLPQRQINATRDEGDETQR